MTTFFLATTSTTSPVQAEWVNDTQFATAAQGALADSAVQPPALDAKQSTSAKGTANGYAGLDNAGLVPLAQLPGLPAAWGAITGVLSAQTDLQSAIDAKQATLVSGTNIKTVNGSTLLGSGNIVVSGSFGATQATVTLPFASRSHRVTVTDAAVSPSSKIILSLAGVPDTDQNAGDDIDILSMLAVPGSGSFQFQAAFLTPMRGPLKINYAIGA